MGKFTNVKFFIATALIAINIGSLMAQGTVVSGKVTDRQGAPMLGVTILVEGSTRGTTTDKQGVYSINAAADNSLTFKFVGYTSITKNVNNQSVIDVVMQQSDNLVDEVVVIGYGSVKKQDLTGSISTIGSKDIKNYPATNFQELLVGRVAGVEATNSSGKPGDVAAVRIRGIGSVNATAPLYVVDGVPLNQTIDIDPRSIESIQILKDASATAIYGSRGSNGVILMTTKKGRTGETSISFDTYISLSKLPVRYPQASSDQLYDFYLETNHNDNTKPDELVGNQHARGYNTDWLDLCTRTGFNQNYSLSITGGTEKLTSSTHIGYTDEVGAMKKNDINKITFRNSNEYTPLKWLKFGNTLGIGYYKINNSLASLDVLLSADPFTPPINPLADPSSANYYYDKYAPTEFSFNTNPLSLLSQSNGWEREFNPFGSLYADVRLVDGLNFKSQVAFEKKNYESKLFEPLYHLVPSENDVSYNSQKYRDVNKLAQATSEMLYLNLEQTLRYEKSFKKHSINAVVGLTWEKWTNSNVSASRTGMPSNDDIFWTLDAGTGGDLAGGGINEQMMISYLGRVNYSYDGKYLATASFRADGSSEFAKGNRWGYFPSFSLGWDISKENFFKKLDRHQVVSRLKLRAGWGQTGNKSAASRSQTVSLMGTSRGTNYFFGNNKSSDPLIAYLPITRGNTALRWETGEQYNVGIDLGLFQSRLDVTVDLYSKYTDDMILTIDLPVYAQFPSSPKANMGSMRNNGIDISATYNGNIKDFRYSISANASMYKSVVLSLGGNPEYWGGSVSRSIIGEEFGRFYTLNYLGQFQTQKQIDLYVDANGNMIQPLALPGDFRFEDIYGDGQITDADRVFNGKPQPSISYGININLAYKNFDATIFLNGVAGNKIFNQPKAFYGKLQKNNILQDLYFNSWRKTGDITKYPRVSAVDLNNNFRHSSWYIEDGSYLKIRNVQIGYTLPRAIINKIRCLKGLRVYVGGQNLYTFTSYSGFDPEVGFDGIEDPRRYIPPRMFIAGLNINF